jgi:hypothetical protein
MKIISLQLLIAFLLLANSVFALANDKQSYQSYIGEYSERHIFGKNTKVDFPRCRQIYSHVLVSGSNEWHILSECDVDQPQNKSIRIWRVKLEKNVGLKIHGEIILPWRPIKQDDYQLRMCKKKTEDEFNAGGYTRDVCEAKPIKQNVLVYFALKDDGTIDKLPFSEIDECDVPECGE